MSPLSTNIDVKADNSSPNKTLDSLQFETPATDSSTLFAQLREMKELSSQSFIENKIGQYITSEACKEECSKVLKKVFGPSPVYLPF